MRRPAAPALALALAALLLAACGEEDAQLLRGETAREINANLDTVQQLADEGDCTGAESAVEQVGEQIDGLEEVDPRLKRALEEGAERLEEVIVTCEESTTESIGPARIPDEEEDEGEGEEEGDDGERDERQQGQGRDDGDEDGGGAGEDGAPEGGNQPPPPASGGEAKGKGPEGEGPPGQGEGGEEEESGGIGPGSAVEEGE